MEDILTYQDPPKGLVVCNIVVRNRHLINQHAFWEILNGKKTRLWDDSSEKREKMIEIQEIRDI